MTRPSAPENTPVSIHRRSARWLGRTLGFVALACVMGWLQMRIGAAVHRADVPAGFAVGLLDGAFMPIAMPTLAIGKDVPIYAALNTGRPYKLGYTVGVNLCGLVFFGCSFWRLSRRRRRGVSKGVRAATPGKSAP